MSGEKASLNSSSSCIPKDSVSQNCRRLLESSGSSFLDAKEPGTDNEHWVSISKFTRETPFSVPGLLVGPQITHPNSLFMAIGPPSPRTISPVRISK